MSLAKIIERIVKIEGPIHREEIARRVASLWGYRRTGSRVVAAVDDAIAYANHEGRVAADGDFFSTPNETTVPIRCRDGVSSSTLRRPEFLPPAEIRTALLEVVRSHLGVAAAEAVVEASRLFGFKSTSGQLREIIESEVDSLVEAGMLELRNGKLYVPRASTADVP